MAKKKCIAEIRTGLHAPPPNGDDPPSKRLKGKTGVEQTVKNEQADIPPRCPFELKWENIEKVMSVYKLSEQDARSNPGVWATYAHRIKQERLEAAQEEAQAAARAADPMLQPILPDNQEGDESLFPQLIMMRVKKKRVRGMMMIPKLMNPKWLVLLHMVARVMVMTRIPLLQVYQFLWIQRFRFAHHNLKNLLNLCVPLLKFSRLLRMLGMTFPGGSLKYPLL